MRKIPAQLRDEMANDEYYKVCSRKNSECAGRITWEHAIIFAGRQVNEKWAIIPLCAYHHAVDEYQDGGDLNKELNIAIALSRATAGELSRVSCAVNYTALKERLLKKYCVKDGRVV